MNISKYFVLALVIIVIDQTSKLLVYNYMYLHQEINVLGDWFRLHYLLNPGMAFGIRWNNEFGKLALTAFRVLLTYAQWSAEPGAWVAAIGALGASAAIGAIVGSVYGAFRRLRRRAAVRA